MNIFHNIYFKYLLIVVIKLMRSQIVNKGGYAGTEFRVVGEKADDQPAGWRHAEKVAWVNPDALIEEVEDGLVVGLEGGNAEDCIPPAFYFKAGDFGGLDKL